MMTKILLAIALGTLVACKTTDTAKDTGTAQAAAIAESSDLTWTEAKARTKVLKEVAYTVTVKLNETDEHFRGTSKIQFTVTDTSGPLRLDLYEGEVKSMVLNGKALPEEADKKFWIEIPAAALKMGANTLTVDYTLPYSKQGQGLHRFVDPQTKEVFLYSQFETFDANRFMPCFDQPEPKATLQLTVEAPAKWEVITTTAEISVTKAATRRIWKFEKTPALSTYLFSLHAGPYKIWRDRFEDIPLRIFARPSMAQYVRAQEWFTITKQGLRFFNNFFAFPYPFKKYDQLFVPEFNAGAMENVGAVTFSENFLRRSQVTRDQRRSAASVLLHEMAHMWFGNIVTMKWWNDLWLNESFATIMAAIGLYEATEFKEAWQDFFADDKTWAYWEDGLVTTHPIEAPVNTVKEAFATFDGITYGKGASVIKQLRAYITPAAFKAGVQDYFKTHAYKNAELKDFIASLQKHTPRDLQAWADRWLRQSGTDKLSAKWSCEGGTLKQIELNTTPAPGREFRPQTVQVALFKKQGGEVRPSHTLPIELKEQKQTVSGPWPCPDFIYPNYQDDGYVKVSLDPKTLSYMKAHLSQIPEVFVRTMIWYDLWEMVRNTEMPLKDYVKILDQHFGPEKDTILLGEIVRRIGGKGSVLHYWPTGASSQAEKEKFIGNMERNFLSRFHAAKPGSDMQKFWFDQYGGVAKSETALNQLAKWAEEKKVGPGFPLDIDRNWTLVVQLSRYQHKEAPRLLEMMKKKDPSDRGQRLALAVEAIQPNYEVKQRWVGQLAQPKPTLPFASARQVLRSMFPLEQAPLAKRFENDFYSYLKANGSSEDENYVEAFAQGTSPLDCEQQSSVKLKNFLDETSRFSPSVVKVLKISLEEDERCQRVRAMAEI
jgi:aminopeptidase N